MYHPPRGILSNGCSNIPSRFSSEQMWENLMTNCFLPAVFHVILNADKSTWPLIYQQRKLKPYAAMRDAGTSSPVSPAMTVSSGISS